MKFRYIFIVIVLISIVVSYFFSREIYFFYVKTYYLTVKKENPEIAAKRAWRLYKDKNYTELKNYLKAVLFLFPENNEIRRIAGLYYIEDGRREEGARLILSSLSKNSHDRKHLAMAIEILFQEGLFTDVIMELSGFSIDDDLELTFIKGVSNYRIKRYGDALRYLRVSKELGNNCFEVYYYLGLINEELKRYDDSIKYLLHAREMNPVNRDTRHALIRLYQKDGQLVRAERLLRRWIHRR